MFNFLSVKSRKLCVHICKKNIFTSQQVGPDHVLLRLLFEGEHLGEERLHLQQPQHPRPQENPGGRGPGHEPVYGGESGLDSNPGAKPGLHSDH